MEGAVHSLQVQKIHIFFNSCVSTLVFQFVKLREVEEGTSLCCLWQTLIGWNEADPMLSKKNFFHKFFWYQKRERKCIYYLPSLISILHSLVWLPRGEDKSIFINLPNHLAFLAPLLLLLCYNHSVWKLPLKTLILHSDILEKWGFHLATCKMQNGVLAYFLKSGCIFYTALFNPCVSSKGGERRRYSTSWSHSRSNLCRIVVCLSTRQ